MSVMPTGENGFILEYTMTDPLAKFNFDTENKFLDQDINIEIVPQSASNPVLSINDSTADLTIGTASSGKYPITASTLQGTAAISTKGWIASGNYNVSDTNVVVGKINQSTMTKGSSTVASGSTIAPTDSAQTISISAGYNGARSIIIGAASSGPAGTVTSGTASIGSLTFTYNSTNSNYDVTSTATIAAPNVNTAGYVSNSIGTLNSNSNNVTTTVPKATFGIPASGDSSPVVTSVTIAKQSISISGVTDAAPSTATATTTAPSSGVWIGMKPTATRSSYKLTTVSKTAGYIEAGEVALGYTDYQRTTTPTETTYIQVKTGTVASPNTTASFSGPTWNNSNSKFDITASGTIAAPTVTTGGWIDNTNGTRNTGSISGTKSLDVIGLTASVSNQTLAPNALAISTSSSDSTITSGTSIVTSKPSSGPYIKVSNSAKTHTGAFSPTVAVSSAGYGDSSHSSISTTAGNATISGVTGYVKIPEAEVQYTETSINISGSDFYYNSTSGKYEYDVFPSDTILHNFSVITPGYISSTFGDVWSTEAPVTGSLNKIGITASISGTPTKKPTITKHNNTNVSASSATTTQPSSGYYVAISSAKTVNNINAVPTVSSAGYGTATSGTYTATNSANTEAGALASDVTYIPITAATFANNATSGTTYTDISSTAPVLVSGDYLYINAGYTPARKISLARLIPDATGANATASYILNGYTAYNNDGALITGKIATYDGTYEVV